MDFDEEWATGAREPKPADPETTGGRAAEAAETAGARRGRQGQGAAEPAEAPLAESTAT